MLRNRAIPCLLLKDDVLVKTRKFKNAQYIGDPINTVRIFNETEVDELIFLDIQATVKKKEPNYKLLAEIANECFMPLAYGGGITNVDQVKRLFNIGLEKVVVNSSAFQNDKLITEIAKFFGSQAVIGVVDVKKNFRNRYDVVSHSANQKEKIGHVQWARELESRGAGELMVTSVNQEGTWKGYDVDLIKSITSAVSIPVIANGGAGSLNHLSEALHIGHASAVAMGSMVVYQKKDFGVLVNFPDRKELEKIL